MISKHLYFLMKWDFKQNYFSVKRDFVNWRYWHIKRTGDIKMMMRKSKWHLQIRFQIKKYPKMGRMYYELRGGNKEWPLYIICFIKTMKRNCFIGKNGINYLILYMKIWFFFHFYNEWFWNNTHHRILTSASPQNHIYEGWFKWPWTQSENSINIRLI